MGRRLIHHDGRTASPSRTTHLPLRRHPHHLYLHAESPTQSPLPPLLLLLRPSRGNELAASGSQTVKSYGNSATVLTVSVAFLSLTCSAFGGSIAPDARALLLEARTTAASVT